MEPDQLHSPRPAAMSVLLLGSAMGAILVAFGLKTFHDGRTRQAVPLMIAGFTVSGIATITFVLLHMQQQRAKAAGLARLAGLAPWLRRADWAKGEIAQQEKYPTYAYFIVAAGVLVAGIVYSTAFSRTEVGPDSTGLLPLVLVGVPVAVLVALGTLQTIRRKKFGLSVFKMSTVPGIIGGKLDGKIELSTRLEPPDGFIVRLRCLNTTGTGKGSKTVILWEDTQQVRASAPVDDPMHTAFPVSFTIPDDCRQSDDTPDNRVVWLLEARAHVPGADYVASFEVPVFKPHSAEADLKMQT